jgi:hypothetical protein
MAAISMAVSALWAQASLVRVCKPGGINSRFHHVWTSRVESTADSAMCGQAWWNQQPILPCVDKPCGINSRFCHVWTSLVDQQPILPSVDKSGHVTLPGMQNQQLILPGVDEPGEGTPWQNQQPILLRANESLVRTHMVESTADSSRCG